MPFIRFAKREIGENGPEYRQHRYRLTPEERPRTKTDAPFPGSSASGPEICYQTRRKSADRRPNR